MDGVAKIRRASEQLRSVEEIQPWWGIPWSRVDRHFVAIDNRGAGRIGERDNAAPNGSRASAKYACRVEGLRHAPSSPRGAIAIRNAKCRIAKAATGCDGLRFPDGR